MPAAMAAPQKGPWPPVGSRCAVVAPAPERKAQLEAALATLGCLPPVRPVGKRAVAPLPAGALSLAIEESPGPLPSTCALLAGREPTRRCRVQLPGEGDVSHLALLLTQLETRATALGSGRPQSVTLRFGPSPEGGLPEGWRGCITQALAGWGELRFAAEEEPPHALLSLAPERLPELADEPEPTLAALAGKLVWASRDEPGALCAVPGQELHSTVQAARSTLSFRWQTTWVALPEPAEPEPPPGPLPQPPTPPAPLVRPPGVDAAK